jgi:hypothetical protein
MRLLGYGGQRLIVVPDPTSSSVHRLEHLRQAGAGRAAGVATGDPGRPASVMERGARTGGRAFTGSLAILAVLVAGALAGIAFDRNWQKLLRVGLAFLAYTAVLVAAATVSRRRPRTSRGGGPPFGWYALAGGSAGLVSGLARPDRNVRVVIASAIGAAVLLGGVHRLAVGSWDRLRLWIEGRP